VFVHHHETGNDALAGQVDDGGASRRRDRVCGTDAGDGAVANDERLVFARRRAGAVDDADMRERNDRRVDLDVGCERICSLLLRHGRPKGLRYEHDEGHDCRARSAALPPSRATVGRHSLGEGGQGCLH